MKYRETVDRTENGADAELLRLCDEWENSTDLAPSMLPLLSAARESVRLRSEREAAYDALEGRLGCGDDDAGKAQKVLWACEAYVLTEDALPGDEFDSEDYQLPKAVAALAAQRDDERDESERLREDVTRLREALRRNYRQHHMYCSTPEGCSCGADAVNDDIDSVLAATSPERP